MHLLPLNCVLEGDNALDDSILVNLSLVDIRLNTLSKLLYLCPLLPLLIEHLDDHLDFLQLLDVLLVHEEFELVAILEATYDVQVFPVVILVESLVHLDLRVSGVLAILKWEFLHDKFLG